MRRYLSKRTTVALAAVLAIGLSVGAYAFFTAGGSGSGTASVGTATPIAITQTAPITGLYPGAGTKPVEIDIKNNGTAAQRVATVTATVTTDKGPACLVGDFVVPPITVDTVINPGQTIHKSGTISMTETNVNQDACQGATLTLAYTSN